MPLLLLRQHMGHLIGNLQIYLQLDVVDSNFAQLQAKVAQAQVQRMRGGDKSFCFCISPIYIS